MREAIKPTAHYITWLPNYEH